MGCFKKFLSFIVSVFVFTNILVAGPVSQEITISDVAGMKASSSEGDSKAGFAFDGKMDTRWESTHGVDPSWLQITFKKQVKLSSLNIAWEKASAKVYRVQISQDGKNWRTVALINDGEEAEERLIKLKQHISTRHLRIYCQERTTQYGYSIWEITFNPEEVNLPEVDTKVLYKNKNLPIEKRVEDLLSRMTLKEKVGQMAQIDRVNAKPMKDIADWGIGSVLSGGGSGPAENTPLEWAKMYDLYQSYALKSRLGIPIIYGVDAVHGHNNVKGAVIFPHNIGMGCTRNPELMEKACRITAIEVAATGIDWTFSPCIAVPRDEKWGRTYEGFGETAELNEIMGVAAVKGYQGSNLADGKTILACPKHFVGDGGTTGGIDQGNTQCSEEILRSIHLPAYKKTVDAGAGSVMVSYSSWNGKKMHGHKYLLTDVLKKELGFKYLLVSDWKAIEKLPGTYDVQMQNAINAGIDMNMIPDDYKKFINSLTNLVKTGKIPISRIDDAVRRILTVKFKLGLFENPYCDRNLLKLVGCPEHRTVARECVRQSCVLLENRNKTLPLSKKIKRIHVAGIGANDIGIQCGGWTIEWQGKSGNITQGTTILGGIRKTVSKETMVTYSVDGTGASGASVGIVVLAEKPYAEMKGDKQKLEFPQSDINALRNLKQSGIPVIVIVISGRPIPLPGRNMYDVLVAAWLPGTEGQGIADVIFGDYNPTGKLSHSWPKDMSQVPINYGDKNYKPMYEYGFGLRYE
ncbi:MAG: glycoside hydrolase family 3 C-terminal domain-containing protein [Elusimicrobia bacterium]|nr:glycoside hydrolase family 3 C-terminal domain-containing protein [Elusimicrobiota bacterium]